MILNSRNIENERNIVEQAAQEMESHIVKILPRSGEVQTAEDERKTVIEALPESDMAKEYRDLAKKVLEAVKAA